MDYHIIEGVKFMKVLMECLKLVKLILDIATMIKKSIKPYKKA
jgi:hypothetical protein